MDSTGMVGQFSMGNEPSMAIPYIYNHLGANILSKAMALSVIPRTPRQMYTLPYFGLRLCVTLAIRLRSAQCKVEDVQITEHRQKERMMNANTIGNRTLRHGNNRSPNDRHDHHSGTISRERTKLCHPQREDAREQIGRAS